jgi:uncharacterized protein YkwD
MKLKLQLAFAFSIPLFLTACGGGGDADEPAATEVAAQSAASQSSSSTSSNGSAVTAPLEMCGTSVPVAEVLARINAVRTASQSCGGVTYSAVPALAWNAKLASAAAAHSLDMASHNFFSHTGSNGSTEADRAAAAGYAYWMLGENIAAGQAGVGEAMDAWVGSAAHCVNLMNSGFKDVGLSCKAAAGSQYGRYWTLVLGASN